MRNLESFSLKDFNLLPVPPIVIHEIQNDISKTLGLNYQQKINSVFATQRAVIVGGKDLYDVLQYIKPEILPNSIYNITLFRPSLNIDGIPFINADLTEDLLPAVLTRQAIIIGLTDSLINPQCWKAISSFGLNDIVNQRGELLINRNETYRNLLSFVSELYMVNKYKHWDKFAKFWLKHGVREFADLNDSLEMVSDPKLLVSYSQTLFRLKEQFDIGFFDNNTI